MGANAQTSVTLFVANAILTAAQQNFSAATGVPVFSTTVTRDAAFGGSNKVLAEGQLCYLESTDVVQYYTGAAWATVGPSGGKVLQVVTATTATSVSTTSTSYVTTGLSCVITPTLATSKVLILSNLAAQRVGTTDSGSFTLFRGTVAGTNLGVAIGMVSVYPATYQGVSMTFLDSPSTTSATTYTAGMKNSTGSDTLRAQAQDSTSSMTLLEIGA